MHFTDIFVKRPVLATVVSLLILLAGLQAVFKLPIRQFPEVSDTKIEITTIYPGANADQIKGFITTPLQQAVASTEGVDIIESRSSQNVSTITLKLRLDANADRALADVLSKVNEVKGVLPEEANDPVVKRTTGAGFALMYISFKSEQMSAPQISDYLDRVVKPKLQAINGVASAEILGGSTFAMRVWLNPEKMSALGITPLDVRNALAANNFTTAAGEVKSDFTQQNINAQTSLQTPEQFEQLVVATRGDTVIRLGQVATVDLGPENYDTRSAFDGLKAVFMGIQTTPDANPLTVISTVRDTMPEIQRQLPSGLEANIAYDATLFINASIWEVGKTLLEASVIVIVVIFLFLGSIRSTIIPVVTIPLSLIGVALVLVALGYSINLLTLLALVLAIGLVVDDAIVVVENIHRHIEEGMTPFDAAIRGAREITGPVIAMTITLAAVYAPIGFTSGLTGALFREFAFTLAGAVIVSGVIALTLSPMMTSKMLKPHAKLSWFGRLVERVFGGLQRFYHRRLDGAIKQRSVFAWVAVLTIVLSGVLYNALGRELAPAEDQGVLFAFVNAPEHTNLDYLTTYTDDLTRIMMAVPERQNLFAIDGFPNTHQSFMGLILKPWDERSRTDLTVLGELQPKFKSVSGVNIFATAPSAIPIGAGDLPIEFVLTYPGDYTRLADTLDKLKTEANKSGLFIFTNADLRFQTPQVELVVDKDRANRLGVTMQDVGATLATLLGGNNVNRFTVDGRSYQVIPQVPRTERSSVGQILDFRVRAADGQMVPLSAFTEVSKTVQPNGLATFQQLNSAMLQGVPFPGRTIGEGIAFLKQKAEEIMPQGMSYDFKGESRQFVKEGNTLTVTFAVALLLIYLVLAAQFESFRDPFIILIGLPATVFGALFVLFILGEINGAMMNNPPVNLGSGTINIYTQIGLVTLIGLIAKHGILMVEFANKLQETKGYDKDTAIKEAAATRLRPILMTTAAMVIGVTPLLVANGAGARSRFDIGVVIAAGMTIGTLFTLFITPAIYSFVARDRRHMHDRENASDVLSPLVDRPANDMRPVPKAAE
ncbi:MAG: efflux RND transporter permease subunit [Aestuariivirga sp.]|uniref:efflux RND transporter permease subunit n=1 Tax=Aestuariivirga sp. TaxID=2650926 RepID=UPI0025BCE856|nr:efflux RND transporter permease subunit [Aestuariivirga sp.]MCA3560620.1 efflux RND transporter permease subunit [Aestuariivirga sp.]